MAVPSDDAVVLGSMQRFSELADAGIAADARVVRRGSGGAEAQVGCGSVWMQLALASPSVLVACTPGRLLNRHVRPLLRALAKLGALAHYYDRDWVSASKAPIAAVSFGHDRATGRCVVEAIIAVTTPFAVRERPSFLGNAPRTLRALGIDPDVDSARVADAILDAYASAYGIGELALDTASEMTTRALAKDHLSAVTEDPRSDPPWAATREEAIGIVAAGRDNKGRLRVGGELMASRDVIANLETEIAAAGDDGARIDRAVDALAGGDVAVLGVRSLRSIRDAISQALESD